MARKRDNPLAFAAASAAFGRRPDPAPAPGGGRSDPAGEGWIVPVVVGLALLLTGLGLWRAEHRALRDPVRMGQRGLVVGIEGRSLLREANLRPALARVAARLDADEVVTGVELSPVAVLVLVRDAEAHQRRLTVGLDGGVDTADAGTSTADGPALARIDPGAPERLVRTALASGGHPGRRVTGLVWRYDAAQEAQTWALSLRDVPIADQEWTADATARRVRRTRDPAPLPAPATTGAQPIRPGDPVPGTPAGAATRTPGSAPARPSTRVRVPPSSNVVVVVVGGTTIVTDPAAGRRLRACVRRARGGRAELQACVDALDRRRP